MKLSVGMNFLLIFAVCLQCKWTCCTTASVSGEISDDVIFIYKTFPVPPSMRAIIEVDISYPANSTSKDGHHQIMGIYTTQDHTNLEKQCTDRNYGQFGNKCMHPGITVDLDYNTSLNCHVDNFTHCHGNITVQDFKPRNFSFSFGFNCSRITPISSLRGLVYNISIRGQTNETNCFELLHADICYRYLQYGADFNLFGRENKKTDRWWSVILTDSKYSLSCYQHSIEFLCYMFVSKCDPNSKKIIPPCREMCHDYKYGCFKGASFDCDYLPSLVDDVPCFYEPVWCKEPPIVKNAEVFTNFTKKGSYLLPVTAEYSCSEGFKLYGNQIISCLRSGDWSKPPHCLTEPKSHFLLILLPSLLIPLTILLLIATSIYHHRMKGKDVVKGKHVQSDSILLELQPMDEPLIPLRRTKHSVVNGGYPARRKGVYDAIVFYNFDSDDSFVMNRLIPELEETRNFKLCIGNRDFTPGLGIKDNIEEAIKASNSAIIAMSQGFVDSMWCKEEFMDSYIENMDDASFKLFVIMMQPADTLVNISPYMKTLFKTKTYLQVHDPELFSKLATQLESARHTIDNYTDNYSSDDT